MDRRLHLSVMSAERAAAIKEEYQPLHPHVYRLKVFCAKTSFWPAVMHRWLFIGPQESYLAPKFKQIVQYCQRKDATRDGLLALLEEAAGELHNKALNSWIHHFRHEVLSVIPTVYVNVIAPFGAVRVYRFPVFEKSFCEQLLEELEHFEQSSAPKGRPNTMNHYGVMYLLWLD